MYEAFASIDWRYLVGFEFHGVRVGIRLDDETLVPLIERIIPEPSRRINYSSATSFLSLVSRYGFVAPGLYFDDHDYELVSIVDPKGEIPVELLESKLLFVLSIVSPPKCFYFHAGSVQIGGHGVLLPGKSFSGKTTLVHQLVKAGARYYTDDCTIVDGNGRLLRFPRPMAMRIDGNRINISAESLGAEEAVDDVPLSLILFTEFREGAAWDPQQISCGDAVFRLINNLFYGDSFRLKPAENLRFLSKVVGTSLCVASPRHDASEVVRWVNSRLCAGSDS